MTNPPSISMVPTRTYSSLYLKSLQDTFHEYVENELKKTAQRKRLIAYRKSKIPAYIKLTKNKIIHEKAIDKRYEKMSEKQVLKEDQELFPEHYI